MDECAVEKVPVPEKSLANQAFPQINYSDSYRVILPGKSIQDVESVTRIFLTSVPSWVSRLMKVRDRLVSLVGLKTSDTAERQNLTLEKGSRIGIFRVMARTSHEVLLGEDDRHLDFRVSLLLDEVNERKYVTISTVVFFHNGLGRLYFFVIERFHKTIVSAMLKNMMRRINFEN
ncbi:DUF2867 domain-containing protein [Sporolactobacillus shoreae]|uniref:DUF2867 domain-containing protein n=1 Tax=Sporolactobacillus shoreae TaxID=1465501 RepID=A0A4Z0GNY8_9BACL|nr:DUF2867 domain-containing protein [Sporolactobacillus shoreae]TGA98893.1 DUF2867 domain-containing protein [Sporolactobacillus shoreae]